ncbi:iron hydrogenase [Choiromyces venosus 120613-1]|uniref:Cytosolic Fe-S cluster assembly factor NAR1 n=1 Tax=Choiromyces venosus 120613-1 TaxID=1336337 RepID=A0A3N4J939_9PEZI|nr:iron hydrogenase [Choiromyces venosus 120613-1]
MSAILSADDLNDFISPGVACIKPIETLPAAPEPPASNSYEVVLEDKAPRTDLPPAQISLTDCLACSGCVTSAEAVLVSLQSHNEVLANLNAHPEKLFVALISPQSKASLATAYGVSIDVAGHMIERLLCSPEGICGEGRGFDFVLDTNAAREVAVRFAAEEVVTAMQGGKDGVDGRKMPILASACPGFVCYLESTQPALIPHLSMLKSPQAILGTAVKSLLYNDVKDGVKGIYVVGVMPCFDKKLEGARGELTSGAWVEGEGEVVRDVDCVITTRELISLAQARGVDFATLPQTPPLLPPSNTTSTLLQTLKSPTNPTTTATKTNATPGTSDGYLIHIANHILTLHPSSTLHIEPGRNSDTIDYVISTPENTIARLSRCYGFRNIQNLVRRLKPAKTRALPRFGKASATTSQRKPLAAARQAGGKSDAEYTYVEVMACPGGCTNGGGQVRYDDEIIASGLGAGTQKEWLGRVDEAYYSSTEDEESGKEDAAAQGGEWVERFVEEWEDRTGVSRDKLLFTGYRKVENDLGGRLKEVSVVELASKDGGGW